MSWLHEAAPNDRRFVWQAGPIEEIVVSSIFGGSQRNVPATPEEPPRARPKILQGSGIAAALDNERQARTARSDRSH